MKAIFAIKDWNSTKIRYLLAGGFNTIFGYSISVSLYVLFGKILHVVAISLAANIIAITVSFLIYKYFVFKTSGNGLKEYFRSYLVYGSSALIGTFCLWLLVDIFNIAFWLSQGLVMLIAVLFSYVGHKRFTFSIQPEKKAD